MTNPVPSQQTVARDLMGAFASVLVTLPSSIAFGVLVFTAIAPEHAALGATAGALGAGALGLVSSLVGRNGGFVTAPCAPAAAVMAGLASTLAHAQGMSLERILPLMVLTGLVAAAMQVGFGAVRLGRLIKYIPYQVVTGYLSAVAVIIAVGQLPKLLGLPDGTRLDQVLRHPESMRWQSVVVGAVSIVAMAVAPRLTKRIPATILGLTAGILAYAGVSAADPALRTLVDNAMVIGAIDPSAVLGAVTGRAASLSALRMGDVALIFTTAATLAALLSIDTLKTGVVLDAMTRTRHDSNRELVAQGVGNTVSALIGGMPGAGTMGPTLVNVTSGGRSPLSGFAVGAFSLVAFVGLGSFIAWVPIAALAGILLVIAWQMFDFKVFRLLAHRQTRFDFVVIAAVVIVAETIGLIEASMLGVGLAILLFTRQQIRSSVLRHRQDLTTLRSKTRRVQAARKLLDENGDQGLLVQLQGDLFFGTTDQLRSELSRDLDLRRYILLDLRRVESLDYTAGHLLQMIKDRLEERGGQLLLSGMPSSLPRRQDLEKYLSRLGLVATEGGIPIFEHRNAAVKHMEDRLLAAAGWTDPEAGRRLDLGDFDLFSTLDRASLAALRQVVEEIHVAAGERLLTHGASGGGLYLVRCGTLNVFLPLPGGKRHHVSTVDPGGSLGEMTFLDGQPRSADVDAGTDADLYRLGRERFEQAAADGRIAPETVFERLATQLSERLRMANKELRALEDR